MKGWVNLNGIYRAFILGAGFSEPAGFPLTNSLLKAIHCTASRQSFPDQDYEYGQAEWLLEELKYFYPSADFSHEMILNNDLPKDFDIEKFLSLESVVSACQLNTSEQYDEHGSRFFGYLKRWIAQTIYDHQQKAIRNTPDFYNRLVSLLKDSLVFTFNWDTYLEYLLDQNNLPYELDSRSNLKRGVIPLFKLHGSVDWFSLPSDDNRREWMDFRPLGNTFGDLSRAKTNTHRLKDYYEELLSPWIIVPAYDKVDQIRQLGDQWSLLYMFFQSELEVIIIGYSMRKDDYHTQAIIYPQLVHGSREGYIKVKVIDYARTQDEINLVKNRYAEITNCQFYLNGFCDEAISFLRDEQN